MNCLAPSEIARLLSKKDLTLEKGHAVSLVLDLIKSSLKTKYSITPEVVPGPKVVSLQDNFWALGYQSHEVTLDSRYTKYVNEDTILRTQMTSGVSKLLKYEHKNAEHLWLLPGIVYRRDVLDSTHVAEPHQLDIWHLTKGLKTREDLLGLVEVIVDIIRVAKGKKNIEWRYNETEHHYTKDGIEVEIMHQGRWVEILECGLIKPQLLEEHGIDSTQWGGLALGVGLERLVMIIKEIVDIRALLSQDPRILKQMDNLDKYKPVSNHPSTKRDLSIAVPEDSILEDLTEIIYSTMKSDLLECIEEISFVSETNYDSLPQVAREKLGMQPGQKNVLIRIVVRHPAKSITSEEANQVYSFVYGLLHQNSVGYKLTTV